MRTALYERVSTEEQERHGLSLAEQSRTLTEYANAHDMQIVGEYIDAGISARKKYTKRPALIRLLNDVSQDKIDTIIFIKLDRWFRNVADYYEVQKILDAHNVTWQATQEDYETATASGRFKVNIMLSVAQDEADRTSERVRFIMQGKRERNEPVSGQTPIGYKIENKHIIMDPDTEPYVRKVFQIYLETGSPGKTIAGVPELKLNYPRLRRMISNTAYKGEYSGISIPAYISCADWNKLQETRSHIVRTAKHNRTYLFSGLMACPVCGCRLAGCYYAYNGKEYFRYRCAKNGHHANCTFNKCIKEPYIEQYLLEHIESKVQVTIKTRGKKMSHKKERDTVKKKLSRLSELYINNMIDMKDYKTQYNKLQDDLSAIPPDEPGADKLKEQFFPDWKDLYTDLPAEGKQAFWRACIESISLNADGTIQDFSLRLN